MSFLLFSAASHKVQVANDANGRTTTQAADQASIVRRIIVSAYQSFAAAGSLSALKEYFESEDPEYLKWGVHVMVAQNAAGQLTVGASHEYGLTHDPFDKHFINQMILDYLRKFARLLMKQLLRHGMAFIRN